jgi:hypothetical protein
LKYIAVLLVGIALGYFLKPEPHTETKLAPEVTNKFQSLIDNEAKNFALQRDADAKLKAAEELYGKMMLLFLANLNVKSSHEFVAVEKPVTEVDKSEVIVTERGSPDPSETVEVVSTPAAETKPKNEIQTAEQIYDKFRSAHYVESFKNKEKRLLGHFLGILNFLRPSDRKDSVVMQFDLVQDGNKLSGNTLVVMTDPNGKEYSRNAGNGGNRAIKINSDEVNSYYVDASPTSFFILSFKKFPRISGQYFEKGKLIGNINMKKVFGDR